MTTLRPLTRLPTRLVPRATLTSPPAQSQARNLTTTQPRRSGGDDHHYDSPGGWLWGTPPGQKAEKEGWENLMYYGFCGSLGVAAVAYAFKPDTSIETWALEEATRRLQKEGILPEEEGS